MAAIHRVQTPGGWAHRAAHHDDASTGFGEWLTQARQARGLTLDDISRETKIPLRNLEALEHGDLGVIPAFYERAEVRAIARAVGIDEQLAMGRLDTAITPVVEFHSDRAEQGVAPPRLRPTGTTAYALSFGVLLAAAGIGWAALGWVAPPQGPGDTRATAGSTTATQSRADANAEPEGRQESVGLISRQTDAGKPPASPEAAAAAPSTASFTEIVVTTDPPGATVTVNGISWGVSPVTIRHLPPGAKRIRATREGFAAAEQVLPLGEGQRETLNLHLSGGE